MNNNNKISYMRVRSMELLETESLEESLLLSQTTKMHIDFHGEQTRNNYSFTLELKSMLLASPYLIHTLKSL